MDSFVINNIEWKIVFVPSDSARLLRSDGSRTVGVTDFNTTSVYLDQSLRGGFLEKVLCHELCHCFCFSYDIHLDINQEEYLADWVSVHGRAVIELLDHILHQKVHQSASR